MITDQQLPQHPGPPWPLPTAAGIPAITSFTVDDVHDLERHARHTVDAVRAEAAERIHSLSVTAARLAEERDAARDAGADLDRENSALVAAAFVLVADGIRREEELQDRIATAEAARDEARRERNIARANERVSDEITAAMRRDLYEKHLELRHVSEQFADATGEIARLQTELDATTTALAEANARLAQAAKRRFRRRH